MTGAFTPLRAEVYPSFLIIEFKSSSTIIYTYQLIDGEVKAQLQIGVDDGWLRWSVPTTAGAHDVTLVVAAVGKGARDRNVCWNMEARQ